jgi:hypothetical protein
MLEHLANLLECGFLCHGKDYRPPTECQSRKPTNHPAA